MKKGSIVVGGLFALGALALWFARTPGTLPPPAPPSAPPAPPPAGPAPPLEVHCNRSRDEILVFVRRREFGLPASGIEVRLRAADGTLLRSGRTDGFGVLRASLPPEATDFVVPSEGGEIATALPPAPPPAAGPPIPILADRSVVRPGDVVRFCVRAMAAPEAVLSFEPADPGVEEIAFSRQQELVAGFPGPVLRWIVLTARVPDDVRPGIAVATVGTQRLEIPLLPRFGAPSDGTPGAATPPPAAAAGDLRVEFRDGAWRVGCREEIATVLLFATAGDRLLSHASTPGEGNEAVVTLPLESGRTSEVRVTALASTVRGFHECSVPAPMDPPGARDLRIEPVAPGTAGADGDAVEAFLAPGPASVPSPAGERPPAALAMAADDPSGALPGAALVFEESAPRAVLLLELAAGGDRRVRALACPADGNPAIRAETSVLAARPAAPPDGPAWVYDGDTVEGAKTPPPTRPAMLEIHRFVPVATPVPFAEPGIPVPAGTKVRWAVPATSAPTALRLRAGHSIVLEVAADGETVTGEFDSDRVDEGPLLLESSRSGLPSFGILLLARVPIRPAEVAASPVHPGTGLELAREFPSKAAAGTVVPMEVRVACSRSDESGTVVRCPLPRGAVPAEDGWSIRERAPAGTRVEVADDAVSWVLPPFQGRRSLSCRIRFLWRGRFSVPPAVALTHDPRPVAARSAGALVVVE